MVVIGIHQLEWQMANSVAVPERNRATDRQSPLVLLRFREVVEPRGSSSPCHLPVFPVPFPLCSRGDPLLGLRCHIAVRVVVCFSGMKVPLVIERHRSEKYLPAIDKVKIR